MPLTRELSNKLKTLGADFVHFVDISQLSEEQNKGFPNAVLIGIVLSPGFIQQVTDAQDYVKDMIRNNQQHEDEFHLKEKATDKLADDMADYLVSKGYKAYSQSENNICQTGFYDEKRKYTPLPHKTIALMAGQGWIGKHNLLVTPEFGSAISICTVLTDAPLKTVLHLPVSSRCGKCNVCVNICPPKVIKGNAWSINTSRDELVDVYKCETCLKCMVSCPWTQAYIKTNR